MQLSNLLSIPNGECIDILTEKEKISTVREHIDLHSDKTEEISIKFNNAIVFSGLINSHDHLDFNLFPQLGNRLYENYVEWGKDIHRQNKTIINHILKIPPQLRAQWGIYKNLLNGITTVVNHGSKLSIGDELVTAWQKTYSLHSVQLEKKWKYKLNTPFLKHQPFSIHVGEGTDTDSKDEIDKLIKWNLFKRKLIGIHGIAMNEAQALNFEALVWCPDSNYFLLGQTANINKLKNKTKILFGTDSTVSSHWSIWEHLRLARDERMVSDAELHHMLTILPAEVWGIPACGKVSKGYDADIVIARKKPGLEKMDAFFALGPEDMLMVLHKGVICLFDEQIYKQLQSQVALEQNYYKIYVNGACKYVLGDLPQLIKTVRSYYPGVHFPITC